MAEAYRDPIAAPGGARIASQLSRRLPWLLVFRGVVATVLLGITLTADVASWAMARDVDLLYTVSLGTYVVVFCLALLLRTNAPAVVLSAVYLATAVMSGALVVHATGGVKTNFSFLYLLAILDGAIVGGRKPAMTVATACTVMFGAQLAAQLYGVLNPPLATKPPLGDYAGTFVLHLGAFYTIAFLAGHLGEISRRAEDAMSTAQADLQWTRDLHARVLASLPVGVLTCDRDRAVLTANHAAQAILGLPVERLVGSVAPAELLGAAHATGLYREIAFARSDGTIRELGVYCARVEGLEGHPQAMDVLVVDDRTDYRALERDLRDKERLASIGALSAAIAHEIRNPLAAVSGAVELLATGSGSPGSDERLRSIVSREVARLNRLIEDFLAYAKPTTPQLQPVDAASITREVVEMVSGTLSRDGPSIVSEVVAAARARLDPEQFRQVLWNLLRNAVDASPPRGRVGVRLGVVDGAIVLDVEDQGPGIPEDVMPHIFEPFRTTKKNGTGLGLAMVRRIVDAHGGSIRMINRVTGGLQASVRLRAGLDEATSKLAGKALL